MLLKHCAPEALCSSQYVPVNNTNALCAHRLALNSCPLRWLLAPPSGHTNSTLIGYDPDTNNATHIPKTWQSDTTAITMSQAQSLQEQYHMPDGPKWQSMCCYGIKGNNKSTNPSIHQSINQCPALATAMQRKCFTPTLNRVVMALNPKHEQYKP